MSERAPLRDPGSFRDPDGFVYRSPDGEVLRQVNGSYLPTYEHVTRSGLYRSLTLDRKLISHQEVDIARAFDHATAAKVLCVERVPFVSYPYEWGFEQLKDAALLTLDVLAAALRHGFTLKDASAFNVMFIGARPVFIDSLSFTGYEDGKPWDGYGQYCRHFLAPLALMALRDLRMASLLGRFLDGIPLDLAMKLLPFRACMRPGLALHLGLHARASVRHSSAPRQTRDRIHLPKSRLIMLIQQLRDTVSGLRATGRRPASGWADYYRATNYSADALHAKKTMVGELVARCDPRLVFDLGGNTGLFSRIARAPGRYVVCFDLDPAAIDRAYTEERSAGTENLLPLVLDLSNPSAALGWNCAERLSWKARGTPDLVLALALLHHLAIAGNLPLPRLAGFFASLTRKHLVIEFVPKQDSQVRQLLCNRDDIFPDYTQAGFEAAFGAVFDVLWSAPIPDSTRRLYLLQTRGAAG